MSIERIIRPALPAHIIPSKLQQGNLTDTSTETPTLEFGNPGASVFTVSISAFTQLETIERSQEISRKVDIARVKNPSNPDNFVDVESTKEILTQGTDGKKRRVEYNPLKGSDTVEIIKKDQTVTRPFGTG